MAVSGLLLLAVVGSIVVVIVVVVLIALILSVLQLVLAIAGSADEMIGVSVLSVVMNFIVFIAANNVKKQVKK